MDWLKILREHLANLPLIRPPMPPTYGPDAIILERIVKDISTWTASATASASTNPAPPSLPQPSQPLFLTVSASKQ